MCLWDERDLGAFDYSITLEEVEEVLRVIRLVDALDEDVAFSEAIVWEKLVFFLTEKLCR